MIRDSKSIANRVFLKARSQTDDLPGVKTDH